MQRLRKRVEEYGVISTRGMKKLSEKLKKKERAHDVMAKKLEIAEAL